VKSTGPVGRQGFVEGLGLNPEMIEAAFAAREGAWLPEAFAVESGYVAVRLADRITPPAEAWEGEKDAWMKSMKQAKEGELFEAFLMDLRARAEVEMVAPELLKTS
jgi:peptidyl-prolyl cis-trans isomerase D